jgi:hypothetical protein
MRRLRSFHLVTAIIVVTALAEISFVLDQPFERGVLIARLLILANVAIAVLGVWTAQRLAWIAYLLASIALAALIGAVTPLSVVGIAVRLG